MTLEELIKQRDKLDEKIAELTQAKEREDMKNLESQYLGKIARNYRPGYSDIIYLRIYKVCLNEDNYSLLGNGVYVNGTSIEKCSEEEILSDDGEIRVVTEKEMLDELSELILKSVE